MEKEPFGNQLITIRISPKSDCPREISQQDCNFGHEADARGLDVPFRRYTTPECSFFGEDSCYNTYHENLVERLRNRHSLYFNKSARMKIESLLLMLG